MSPKIRIIKELLNEFCHEILNSEAYAEICSKILTELEQHPHQPLNRGKEDIWAASIAHAVGSINLLFSTSSYPHISVDELNSFFNTKSTTTSKKSLDLRDLLRISSYNEKYQIDSSKQDLPIDQMKEMLSQKFGISEEEIDTILNNVHRPDSPIIPKTEYSSITIVPKQKFWDWVGTQINLEEMDSSMKTDCNVYLIPDIELDSSLEMELHVHFEEIFKIEFTRYINADSEYPKLNFMEFLQWFDIRSSTHVMDLTGELLDDMDNEDFSDDKSIPPDYTLN